MRCPAAAVEAVAEILREGGAYGVEILGDLDLPPGDDLIAAAAPASACEVAAYLPEDGAERRRRDVAALCAMRVEPFFGPVEVRAAPAPKVDWVAEYQRRVRAMRVTAGLWVEPPWDAARPRPGELVLRITPGAAFGFGDHPSTVTCLRLLQEFVRPGQDVIDMGSGSGILGAAALLLGAGRLRACDLDPLAVQATRDTLRRNGLRAHVRLGSLTPSGRPADLILANISGRGLRPWLGPLRRRLRPGGRLILGGILRADREFEGALRAAALRVVRQARQGEWRAIAAEPA